MQGDDFRKIPEGAPSRAPLKTHEFRWDPFERLKIGGKARLFAGSALLSKRLAIAVGAVVVAVGAAAGASMLVAGDSDAHSADMERGLVEREARLKQREDKVTELERRRASSEIEIKDGEKRIADLERRRAELQRQVAELTAPVAPSGDETPERSAGPSDERAALSNDDPSPPDEAPAAETGLSASSRIGSDDARPSSARVERTAVREPEDAVDEAVEPAGPVRVFIHVRSADPAARERAEAVAAELKRRGVAVAQIRGVVRPVRRDAVRFYYDADRGAVSALQDAVRMASPISDSGPQSQDYRGYRAPPKRGTLELWLS